MVLEVLGALIRGFISFLIDILKGKRERSFSNYFGSSNEKKNQFDKMDQAGANAIIGFIFLALIVGLIYILFIAI